MGKVKKGATKKPTVSNSGLPFKIRRFLKHATAPRKKVKYPPFIRHLLSISPPYVQRPAGYLPPACEEAIELANHQERIIQLLEYAKDPARYDMMALGRKA